MNILIQVLLVSALANPQGAQEAPEDGIQQLEQRVEALERKIAQYEATRSDTRTPLERIDGETVIVKENQVVPEVSAMLQDAIIAGRVTGDVTSFGGSIIVRPTGVVDGDAVSIGGEITVENNGIIKGKRAELPYSPEGFTAPIFGGAGLFEQVARRLIFLLTFAGLGVLMIGLFPDRIHNVATHLKGRPFRSLFGGTLWVTIMGVLSGLFAIICIGLPLSIILLSTLGLAWLLGFVGLCQLLGDRLPFNDKTHGRWLTFLIGSAVVSFISVLPWIGVFALIVTGLMGVGAAFSTRFGTR